MAQTYQHDWANRSYPAPGQSPKTDGFSIRMTGTEDIAARLLAYGPAVKTRILRVLETVGREIAVEAGRGFPPAQRRQKRRRIGWLGKSFGVRARPRWEQLGLVGVVVRSSAKYHYYQEFGVNRPDTQVVRHVDDAGKRVTKGQGVGRRYREGSNRLNDGVRVKTYRRDIMVPGNPSLGRATSRLKGQFAAEVQNAVANLLGERHDAGSGI